ADRERSGRQRGLRSGDEPLLDRAREIVKLDRFHAGRGTSPLGPADGSVRPNLKSRTLSIFLKERSEISAAFLPCAAAARGLGAGAAVRARAARALSIGYAYGFIKFGRTSARQRFARRDLE